MKNTQIGIDNGGTVTDIVVSHNSYISKIKVLSTPSEYSKGVMTGLSEAINRLKVSPENISEIVHATTLATNAILEKKGVNCHKKWPSRVLKFFPKLEGDPRATKE